MPSAPPAMPPMMGASQGISLANGLVPMIGLKQLQAEEKQKAEATQRAPLIQGLASHVRQVWTTNRMAKQQTIEPRLLASLRQRRGEYDPDLLAEIRKTGGSEIYMMISSVKCRAAASWLRDTLLGTGTNKPWGVSPSPMPDLPPQVMQFVQMRVQAEAAQYTQMTGQQPTPEQLADAQAMVKDRLRAQSQEAAKKMAGVMELKMEDQMMEGGWYDAFDAFLDDITTFPSAFLKGPVVRNKPSLSWEAGELKVEDKLTLEWERVDPFDMYPSPQASGILDGDLIERHRMSRQDLNDLKGVEGYDESSIKAVLDEYGRGGLREWLTNDTSKAIAEGKSAAQAMMNPDHLIDALQFWGSVQGKQLIEWNRDLEDQIDDPTKEYQCEVWLIGSWVIKATLNPDPLGRRPYYKASYEEVPGVFWGNSVCDLVRDVQGICNAAARALANNMAIASGPQMWINVDRMPSGEPLTEIYPWKVHQTTSDPYGGNSSQAPVGFFQPQSNAQELLMTYDKFSILADEYTGVPRYMSGDAGGGGALRTSSGMSMLMTNAGKAIKQVIGNIDTGILKPVVERLYFYNMMYSDDPELKGDVNIVSEGANQLVVKESVQQRRNEFLQLVLQSPLVQQVVPPKGLAALLREVVKTLDMDADEIVPSDEQLRLQQIQAQAMQAAQAQQANQPPAPQVRTKTIQGPDGVTQEQEVTQPGGQAPQQVPQNMMPSQGPSVGGGAVQPHTGEPVTNHFAAMSH